MPIGVETLSRVTRDRPSGTIRISATEHASKAVLWPKVDSLLAEYPDINIEISSDLRFVDIVDQRFDAGIRIGEHLEKDMISVRLGPKLRMAVVASPAYLADRPIPSEPRELTSHTGILLRMPHGGLFVWDFEKDGRQVTVPMKGRIVFNIGALMLDAVLAGHGLLYTLEDTVQEHLAEGRLIRMLEDWCPPFSGYHLYYPSRKQNSLAFRAFVDAVRYRE